MQKKVNFHIIFYLLSLLFVVVPSVVKAQSVQIADSANFVRASVMIASPDYGRTQSSFGHMFLRMECPSAGLDYCFSFESAYAPGVFSIFTGNYNVRLVRVNSNEYMRTYADELRMITSYPLNLRLPEEQRLWKRLDEIHAMGDYPEHDYFHHGCSQELMNIITEIVDGRIVYDESRLPEGRTINILGPSALPADHPVRLAPLLFGADGTDRVLPPGQRLFMPVAVPDYLRVAEIEDLRLQKRPLLDGAGETFFAEDAAPYEEGLPIWSWFLMAFLAVVLISGLELLRRSPRWLTLLTDIAVLAVYLLMTVLLCAVYAVSTLPTTSGWCWHFLVYNPLFLLLAILAVCRVLPTKLLRCSAFFAAGWMVLYMTAMAIAGDMLWGYQYLMISTFAIRSLAVGLRKRSNQKNRKQNK